MSSYASLDPDGNDGWSASIAIRRIGLAALPALAKAVRSPDARVRESIAIAIQSVRPSEAALAQALKDQDVRVRRAAACVIRLLPLRDKP
jgi:HEAT repeat protein